MVREDILGGLKTALRRGESLRQAMITLHNAGYEKEEIEQAAKSLHVLPTPVQPQQPGKQIPKQKPISFFG